MPKKDKQREQLCIALGRELSRRAKSRCELCSASTSLSVVEVAPLPEEPSVEKSLFLCDVCHKRLTVVLPNLKKKSHVQEGDLFQSNDLLFLQEKIWSETAVIQVTAILLSHKAKNLGYGWAFEMIDSIYMEENIEHWFQELRTIAKI